MTTTRFLLISAFGLVLCLGHESFLTLGQASPSLVTANDVTVQDGAKVTVWFQITPFDSPTTTYSDTERFIQGQHVIPPGLEQRIAGMHPGEVTTFPLSAEEGFGPYDETKVQTVPPSDLPLDAREGDTVANSDGITAKIVMILPEKALLDLNHPLAGKPLWVTLKIVTVESSDEEATLP